MNRLHNLKELLERRRELRNSSTTEESILWECLRNRKIGFKFKRQHSIEYFIVDFYCPEKNLVIEIDGERHNFDKGENYDSLRDEILEEYGYKTLRVKNNEIRNSLKEVLNKINHYLNNPLL